MKPHLILHLGMSKTATTWLQEEVFPGIPGVAFRDQPGGGSLDGGPMQGTLARAFRRSPSVWCLAPDVLFRELCGTRDGVWASGRSLLISDQSAGPRLLEYGAYRGAHWERERMDPVMMRAHLEGLAAEATRRGFNAVRAIVVFRRQDHWLASKYAQRSDRIVRASQAHFEERLAYYLDPRRGWYSDGVLLRYELWLAELAAALGRENVLFLPYELLRRQPREFLIRILAFHGLGDAAVGERVEEIMGRVATRRTNVRSHRPGEWELRRPEVSWRPSVLRRREGLLALVAAGVPRGKRIRLEEEMSARILEAYRPGNEALADATGFDLESHGYFGPDDPGGDRRAGDFVSGVTRPETTAIAR